MQQPTRVNFVRWIMPGCWEDTEGVHHFDVDFLHRIKQLADYIAMQRRRN